MTKRNGWMVAAFVLGMAVLVGATQAADAKKGAATTYLVIAPHTAAGCLSALDHMAEAKQLEKFEFGCSHGDHTGYARVTASSAEEALATVPAAERSQARAVALERFTPEQLAAIHKQAKN